MTLDQFELVKEHLHRLIESSDICELNAYREGRSADAEWHQKRSEASRAAIRVLAQRIIGESK